MSSDMSFSEANALLIKNNLSVVWGLLTYGERLGCVQDNSLAEYCIVLRWEKENVCCVVYDDRVEIIEANRDYLTNIIYSKSLDERFRAAFSKVQWS